MKNSKLFIAVFLMLGMMFMGYQCGSTEITSAKLYIQQKNYPKAIEVLQKEITKNPKSDEGYYLLGYVYGETNNYPDMVAAYNKSLEISKTFEKNIDDSKKYFWAQSFNRGVNLYQRGMKSTDSDSAKVYYDKSISEFNSAIMIEPDSIDNYKNLAFVYLSKGDNDGAIAPLQKLIEKNKLHVKGSNLSELPVIGSNLSELEAKLGKPDKVIESNYKNTAVKQYIYEKYNLFVYLEKNVVVGYDKISEGKDEALDGYKYLGEIYYINGNNLKNQGKDEEAKAEFNKAIDVLQEGLKLYPNDSDILLTLSNSFIGAGRTNEAIEPFKKGVEAEPENKYYRYNYGVLLLGIDDYQGAETQFKKAIEIDSVYDNAIYNLGVTYVKWGNYLNKKADEEGKLSEEYKDKYRLALPYLKKAAQMKDATSQTWEFLGKVYSVLGMQNEANDAFKKADEMRK
jgi:tetratricopeptide (TPR) repeat protein